MWIGIPESLFLTEISVKGHAVVRAGRDCLVQQQLAWGGQEAIGAATDSRDRTRRECSSCRRRRRRSTG